MPILLPRKTLHTHHPISSSLYYNPKKRRDCIHHVYGSSKSEAPARLRLKLPPRVLPSRGCESQRVSLAARFRLGYFKETQKFLRTTSEAQREHVVLLGLTKPRLQIPVWACFDGAFTRRRENRLHLLGTLVQPAG